MVEPSRATTHDGGVGFPLRSQYSILPRCTIEVAQSMQKGNGSSVGRPNVRGFVPIMFSTPNVGAMLGRAFVPVMPISPWSVAIPVQYPAMP